MKKYAFFDFDNTLYDGFTYNDFIDHCSTEILKTDKFQVKTNNLLKNTDDYNQKVLGMVNIIGELIKGWTKEEFKNVCKLCCTKVKIYDWVNPVLTYLKSQNFTNIIVSASFDEMVLDSVDAIPIDKFYCSSYKLENSIYTGDTNLILNDTKKADVVKKTILNDETFSIAFGDSIGDIPMLESVNKPFLIQFNDNAIKETATKNNWFKSSNADLIINEIKKSLKIK